MKRVTIIEVEVEVEVEVEMVLRFLKRQIVDTKKPRHNRGFFLLVGERGFEPPTHWSQTSCATRLRYSPSASLLLSCLLVRRGGLEPPRPLEH